MLDLRPAMLPASFDDDEASRPALHYRMLPALARRHYGAYGLICLIWGSTWGAIRLLVRDIPALRAAGARFLLAGLLLALLALLRRRTVRFETRQWWALIILGLTMMGLPYGLLFWAEYRISSSMSAILFSSCPLFVALFTPLMSRTRVPRRAVLAMLIALGAIAVLFYSGLSGSPELLLGGGAVMLAVVISGWSAVFAKRELRGVSPIWGTAVQFIVAAVSLFIASWFFERQQPSDWNRTSLLALGFLTIFGSVIAFSLYYWLLETMHAYQLSTTNLVIPIIAMAEGAVLLRENVSLTMALSAALVLVSVGVVLRADEHEAMTELGLTSDAVRTDCASGRVR